MSNQSSTKTPQTLNKLVRLYDLRQNKARKQYQQQQRVLAAAQAKFDQCERDQQIVDAEAQSLRNAAYLDEFASNLRAQQQIQVKRHWLKYDSEKTEYFLNDARCDLDTELEETDRLRSQWMQLRSRHEEYQSQHRSALSGRRHNQLMREEHEQADEALGRRNRGRHHG